MSSWNATGPEVYCRCERLQFRDGKHTEEALAAAEVIISYGRVVLLAGCVEDVDLDLLSVQHHFLPVAVCFSGLVVFHKLQRKREREKQNPESTTALALVCSFVPTRETLSHLDGV